VERKFVGTIESDPSEALGLPIRVAMHRVFQLVCVIAGTLLLQVHYSASPETIHKPSDFNPLLGKPPAYIRKMRAQHSTDVCVSSVDG
jgi:hypothetical protein